MTTSALIMSTQWLVIAPLPNEAASPATVELCQRRAWCSMYTRPMARMSFTSR
jgi:hypothetical protein